MNATTLQQYWAPIAASVLILGVILFVLYRLLEDSRRGRLARALNHLRDRERALAKAGKEQARAQSRLDKLQRRGDSVPPARVLEARDALQAADETVTLLSDQLLVVRNNTRTIILEDYPPNQHAAMLKRCLGESR